MIVAASETYNTAFEAALTAPTPEAAANQCGR
jgi:hypothetical protein